MALPTYGRVLLDTTAGDIDIELWSKVRNATMTCACLYKYSVCLQEAPKACRNFIALAMEGTHSCYASRPCIWLWQLYNCLRTQVIMTGSSFIGQSTLIFFTQYSSPTHLPARPPFSLLNPFRLLSSRVVPDFLVQTGDRTGTGAGGESFFGGVCARRSPFPIFVPRSNWRRTTEQFEDEIHPRLRFAHRGLVAMANSGKKNSNDSQFFITLGAVYPYFTHAPTRFSFGMMQTRRMSSMVNTHCSVGV